jgi:hypothetical protein
MLDNTQNRMDAVKKFLCDTIVENLDNPTNWLKAVKDEIDVPVPLAPRGGLMGLFV